MVLVTWYNGKAAQGSVMLMFSYGAALYRLVFGWVEYPHTFSNWIIVNISFRVGHEYGVLDLKRWSSLNYNWGRWFRARWMTLDMLPCSLYDVWPVPACRIRAGSLYELNKIWEQKSRVPVFWKHVQMSLVCFLQNFDICHKFIAELNDSSYIWHKWSTCAHWIVLTCRPSNLCCYFHYICFRYSNTVSIAASICAFDFPWVIPGNT